MDHLSLVYIFIMMLWYKKLKDKLWSNWIFFLFVSMLFVGVSVFDPSSMLPILSYFWKTIWSLLPILLLVYGIIFIFSVFLSHKNVVHFLAHGGYTKKMFLAIITWIISSWPTYLRYGFLKKLHTSWLTLWHIAGFSYARAIKPPLFALMIYYFDVKYTIIFVGILFVYSFVQCFLVDFLTRKNILVDQ
jgi:hypothetical protein